MAKELERENASKKKSEGGKKGAAKAGRGRPNRDGADLHHPNENGRAPRSADQAAAALGVKPRGVQEAIAVMEADPEIYKQTVDEETRKRIEEAQREQLRREGQQVIFWVVTFLVGVGMCLLFIVGGIIFNSLR